VAGSPRPHPPPGRALPPTSRFAGDTGACDPALADALAVADDAARAAAVAAVLGAARVLVPVVARPDERTPADERGLPGERVTSAATITVAGPDGRAVTPVFSSVDALTRWDPTARPVPVEGVRAAVAAAAEADGLLVLDPAGPLPVLLPRPAVWAVAQRRAWRPAPRDPEVAAAVAGALAGIRGVTAVRCEAGGRAELRVVLAVAPGLDRAGLDAVVAEAGQALARTALVVERVDSLELRVVPAPA
jgi:hypothetical protein